MYISTPNAPTVGPSMCIEHEIITGFLFALNPDAIDVKIRIILFLLKTSTPM